MMIRIKRAYDEPTSDDGYRILVDRLWPRGIKKDDLVLDEWAKDLAPSAAARRAFGHDPKRWPQFRTQYKQELRAQSHAMDKIRQLAALARKRRVTLLFAAKDETHNNAVVLRELLQSRSAARKTARNPRSISDGALE